MSCTWYILYHYGGMLLRGGLCAIHELLLLPYHRSRYILLYIYTVSPRHEYGNLLYCYNRRIRNREDRTISYLVDDSRSFCLWRQPASASSQRSRRQRGSWCTATPTRRARRPTSPSRSATTTTMLTRCVSWRRRCVSIPTTLTPWS